MADWIRSLRCTSALAALALLLAGGPGTAAAAETIKVGFMAPLSGIFAQAGKDMWTYKPDEFLKLPAYSRDYPPARP